MRSVVCGVCKMHPDSPPKHQDTKAPMCVWWGGGVLYGSQQLAACIECCVCHAGQHRQGECSQHNSSNCRQLFNTARSWTT